MEMVPWVDPVATVAHSKEHFDTNYPGDSVGEADSHSELKKLRLENQALMQLLKDEYKKRTQSS